jgi:hypothetical protein
VIARVGECLKTGRSDIECQVVGGL